MALFLRQSWLRASGTTLSSLSSGAAALAFPIPSLWPVALFVLVPSIVAISKAPTVRRAAFLGWLGGASYFLTTHYWMAHKTLYFHPVIAAVFGTTWIPWALAARATLGKDKPLACVLAVPSLWILAEYLRSWDVLGGPWALIGATQWNSPWGLQVASWGGVWLVGWVLLATNSVIAGWAVVVIGSHRRDSSLEGARRASMLLAACSVCSISVVAGAWVVRSMLTESVSDTSFLRVAGVQPGVIDPADERFATAEAITAELHNGYDLVVWGESSVGEDPFSNSVYMERLESLAFSARAPLLANVDARTSTGSIYKTSLLVEKDGPTYRYDKRRLVPFGEYVPLRPLFGWVSRFTDAAEEDRGRGSADVIMELPHSGVRIAPLICFESAFTDVPRSLVRKGADVLVVQSATTTFQESWLPAQHASLAALRAAESGRPVIHATLSGVSAAFDAYGRQLAWVGTDHRGTWSADIPLFESSTFYTRLGDWPVWGAAIIAFVLGLSWLTSRHREQRRKERGSQIA